jgi:hypothetical protein
MCRRRNLYLWTLYTCKRRHVLLRFLYILRSRLAFLTVKESLDTNGTPLLWRGRQVFNDPLKDSNWLHIVWIGKNIYALFSDRLSVTLLVCLNNYICVGLSVLGLGQFWYFKCLEDHFWGPKEARRGLYWHGHQVPFVLIYLNLKTLRFGDL